MPTLPHRNFFTDIFSYNSSAIKKYDDVALTIGRYFTQKKKCFFAELTRISSHGNFRVKTSTLYEKIREWRCSVCANHRHTTCKHINYLRSHCFRLDNGISFPAGLLSPSAASLPDKPVRCDVSVTIQQKASWICTLNLGVLIEIKLSYYSASYSIRV